MLNNELNNRILLNECKYDIMHRANSSKKSVFERIEELVSPSVYDHLQALDIATLLMIKDGEKGRISIDKKFDLPAIIYHTLEKLATPPREHRHSEYDLKLDMIQYLNNLEDMVEAASGKSRHYQMTGIDSNILACFQSLAKRDLLSPNSILHNMLPYKGRRFAMSVNIGCQAASICSLPQNPQDAKVLMGGYGIMPVFEEYYGKQSAEACIQLYYGTDGLYAEHYRDMLDLRYKYPSQKHLFY